MNYNTRKFMADLIHSLQPSENVLNFTLHYDFEDYTRSSLTVVSIPLTNGILAIDSKTGQLPEVSKEYEVEVEEGGEAIKTEDNGCFDIHKPPGGMT